MKIFFLKKSKIGHGITTQNWILRSYTVTEFSKTFLVFYKWPDLTDVQVMLTGTVPVRSMYINKWIYCTRQRNLNVGQIRPFIENWESFRKFCHGGPTQNSILRRTTVTDFWFFEKKYFHRKIQYVFRRTSWVNITGAQSKSSKILENPESWDRKFP